MRDEPEKVNAERWNAKKTEGCDGCLSVYFTRPLITGSGWVLWYDDFTAAPRAGWEVRLLCSTALYTSTTTLVVVYPPLNLTEDLTDKMLVHVNKNNIAGFIFEHSFQWYNFRWHESSLIVLYIMLVQFLVVLIYSSKVPVRCTEEWNALIGSCLFWEGCGGHIMCNGYR